MVTNFRVVSENQFNMLWGAKGEMRFQSGFGGRQRLWLNVERIDAPGRGNPLSEEEGVVAVACGKVDGNSTRGEEGCEKIMSEMGEAWHSSTLSGNRLFINGGEIE
jgi:hypothetical protein